MILAKNSLPPTPKAACHVRQIRYITTLVKTQMKMEFQVSSQVMGQVLKYFFQKWTLPK